MKDFAGRVAFVTGGANGVGIGLVRALKNEGCKVVMADIRQDSIDKALGEIDSPDVMGIQLDVSSREQFAEAAAKVEETFGPVSVLFNNAGVNLFQTIEESSYDDWDWLLGVNLHGVINGVMTFAPRMIQLGKGGHICNTASMAAFIGSPIPGIYNTTKFAVRGLSESIRWSLLEHNISVSLLCPGLVKSYIYASDDIRPDTLKGAMKPVDNEAVERLAGVHEFGMEPDEIARRTIEAIRAHRFFIFPHPDHKDELQMLADEVIASYVDYPKDPGFDQRVGFEKMRQERAQQLRNAWENAE
ncbi:MAG: SDR family NAD(P)-dependent oxidoreductase [Sphingomonadaceae bacterium]